MTISSRLGRAIFSFVLAAVMTGAVMGQEQSPAEMLKDFVHYTKIARPALAQGSGQKLLQSGITPAELAALVDDETAVTVKDFDWAVDRGSVTAELELVAVELGDFVEQGRLDLARDADRIKQAIQMLVGTQRQRRIGRARLLAAGEYAVPHLLRVITDEHDGRLKDAAAGVLRESNRFAVAPLCEALPEIDPVSQRRVCEILADISYPSAAPTLRAVILDETTDGAVRDAARRAFDQLGGLSQDLDVLYTNLARQYFRGDASLVAYPLEDTNNVWFFDPHVGLTPVPVPTEIYAEVMAMENAAIAIMADPTNPQALALYVAANLKRENDLPDGTDDPIYGQNQYTPGFYATVFGTQVCLDVLALAIDATDTPLVRDAIAALRETTGGSNLFSTGSGRQPLLEAIIYPDRRVQYEAALTLARALPDQGFAGADRVVPLLASAVRSGSQQFAIVIADDDENRRLEVGRLETLGYTVVGAERDVTRLGGAIADAPGVDLALVRMNDAASAEQMVSEVQGRPKTKATPITVLAQGVDVPELKLAFQDDDRVAVARAGIDDSSYGAVLDHLLARAVGGRMTESEAEAYAIEAIAALRDIAISNSQAYDIEDAESALVAALETRTGGTRLLVASVLALIGTDSAQRTLLDTALSAEGGERIDMLNHAATSVKRFGDRSEQRHMVALLDLIENSGGSTAEAAARVHGAMNLSESDAVRLVQP